MNPPPMTWTRSICAASSIPACQRGATPGSLMARCTNAATSHGSSQHNRQNVRETHTGMEVPQQHAARPRTGAVHPHLPGRCCPRQVLQPRRGDELVTVVGVTGRGHQADAPRGGLLCGGIEAPVWCGFCALTSFAQSNKGPGVQRCHHAGRPVPAVVGVGSTSHRRGNSISSCLATFPPRVHGQDISRLTCLLCTL